MQNIFCYGTLKKGFRSHHLLENYDAIFVKKIKTMPKYQLYRINWFPGMVVDEIDGLGVQGEVYSVSDECLEALDQYEGVHHYEGVPTLFRRDVIELNDGTTALAYIFNQSFVGKEKIESGEWTDGKEENED